jgi:hypothetical protein
MSPAARVMAYLGVSRVKNMSDADVAPGAVLAGRRGTNMV